MRSPRPVLLACCVAILGVSVAPAAETIDTLLDRDLPRLVEMYKSFHASPELSHHEEKTSAVVAKELKSLGFTVIERIGKYDRAEWVGYGVAAVLKNGAGPTVLVRTDMDGLPVEERTALPYASKVATKTESGQEVKVMHACGHDVHMTSLLGAARLLVDLKDRWRGTLVMIGQPAEETIDGARAMLSDGLYDKVPRPDFALALHDNGELAAGKVAFCPEYALASSSSVDITIRGVGGHGSKPEIAKDPIVIAAQVVVALQTIVSREVSPLDSAVVTVGSIHGGTKRNIIPTEVKLLLTVRAYRDEVRKKLLASIERIATHTALAAGIPKELAPIVEVLEGESTPATYNDPALTQRVKAACEQALGAENVLPWPQIMASEDFGHFGLENRQIPCCIFWLGAADPAKVAASKESGTPLPSLHSAWFAPLPEPTLRTGVKAMTSAVLDLLKK